MIALSPDRPVVIAGPTGSGKSALALHIAENQGGVIVNADALQVFDGWRIVTARPADHDLGRAAHHLYGHVPYDASYSVGHWLRDVTPHLNGLRPIIVGGTGLYLTALTEGLADIPATPDDIRSQANDIALPDLIAGIDPITRSRIDTQNRVRVQRAWEVQHTTNRSLADWQDNTPPAILPREQAHTLVLDAPKEWLTPRIAQRFDMMLQDGALAEAEAMLPTWDPTHLSSKAIGAPELIAHLQGRLSKEAARDAIVVASTQYAKRQRTWFRKRMRDWTSIPMVSTDLSTIFTFPT